MGGHEKSFLKHLATFLGFFYSFIKPVWSFSAPRIRVLQPGSSLNFAKRLPRNEFGIRARWRAGESQTKSCFRPFKVCNTLEKSTLVRLQLS